MRPRLILLLGSLLLVSQPFTSSAAESKPLRALLVTGGCCHNYPFQTQQLTNAIAKLASVAWTIVTDGGTGTRAEISLYDNPDWAKGYDVVIHNECFADTTNQVYIRKITTAHKAGVPAVVIHCAMHTYRSVEIDDWREFLGVTSKRHDHQSKYPVKLVKPENPILKGVAPNWITPMDELYIIEKVWPNTTPLATSVSERDGKTYPVIWTNQYGKARVFGTTYGHSDDMWRDENFLAFVSRGTLWAAGRLAE
ncbi:MAG: ThuA domain-containing protein [Verrucomicrobiota bacterium]